MVNGLTACGDHWDSWWLMENLSGVSQQRVFTVELMICQERVSDSHWITTNTPKGLKDNSGLFQRSVFPTNVTIVALWVTLDVYYKNVTFRCWCFRTLWPKFMEARFNQWSQNFNWDNNLKFWVITPKLLETSFHTSSRLPYFPLWLFSVIMPLSI